MAGPTFVILRLLLPALLHSYAMSTSSRWEETSRISRNNAMKSQLGLSGFYQNFCGRDGRVNSRMVVWMGSRCYVWMCGCHYDVFRSVGCSLKNVDWFNYCCYQRQQNRIYLLGDVCHLLACKFGLCRLFVCLFLCLFLCFCWVDRIVWGCGFFFFFFFNRPSHFWNSRARGISQHILFVLLLVMYCWLDEPVVWYCSSIRAWQRWQILHIIPQAVWAIYNRLTLCTRLLHYFMLHLIVSWGDVGGVCILWNDFQVFYYYPIKNFHTVHGYVNRNLSTNKHTDITHCLL